MSRCRRKYVDLGHRSAAGNKAGHNLPSALRCKLLRVQRRLVALLAMQNFAPVAALLAILNVVPNIAAAGASLVARRVCPPMDYSPFPGGDFPNTFVVADREDLNKLCRSLACDHGECGEPPAPSSAETETRLLSTSPAFAVQITSTGWSVF